ncbi:WSCD family member GA21586 [Dendroctonus ponderosae]|uniref:Sulfotransferase domain-containing protein n=2 Tax=Dendroctonus ponderosae TaxID=77166 RepID=U4U9Z9_DENPD|nr:WSCD family member GA21586 [Dendroctonus ponderosae]ERL89847.1 hypothetical protein D910_07207 [Dendroctonus ponderosae]KAH1003185.1 hypothetical protein HUJ05_011125 [Dendroctonus ponderosae]
MGKASRRQCCDRGPCARWPSPFRGSVPCDMKCRPFVGLNLSLRLLVIGYVLVVVFFSVLSLHQMKKGAPTPAEKQARATLRPPSIPRRLISSFERGPFRPLRRWRIEWCAQLQFMGAQPGRPVALVSFPGSGNTWLRYLLQQATGYLTGSVYNDLGLSKNGFPAEGVVNRSVLVVKTHEYGSDTHRQFDKALLLVRAPQQAIQAEFNRQSGGHIGFASPDRYARSEGKFWQRFVALNLRNWERLNLDWLRNFPGPTHVLTYQQLVNDTEHALKGVLQFLGVAVPPRQLQCALEHKEGIYRRRSRVRRLDPFTAEMRAQLKAAERRVFSAISPSTNKRT